MKPFAAVLAILALVFGLAFVFRSGGTPSTRPRRQLEAALVCTTCHEPLDESSSPLALQMKAFIRAKIAAGWTTKQIDDHFVAELGPQVLAIPKTSGFDLLAWLLPFAAIVFGAAAVGCRRARVAPEPGRRRARARATTGRRSRRASSSGSTRSSRGSTADFASGREGERFWGARLAQEGTVAEKLPVAFLAGLISVITPCVLPLVPGYLSAVSAIEVDQLGERGSSRRVVHREHPVHRRVHRRLRPARRRARPPSRAPSTRPPRRRSPGSSSSCSGSRSSGSCRGRSGRWRPGSTLRAAADRLGRAPRRRLRRRRGAVHRHRARLDPRARELERRSRPRRRPAARLLARARRGVRARRGRVRARDALVPLGALALPGAAHRLRGRS